MTRWIGAAMLMRGAIVAGCAATGSASAASLSLMSQQPQAATVRRASHRLAHRSRCEARADRRTDDPDYSDRPRGYTPLPFVPLSFGAGFGPR